MTFIASLFWGTKEELEQSQLTEDDFVWIGEKKEEEKPAPKKAELPWLGRQVEHNPMTQSISSIRELIQPPKQLVIPDLLPPPPKPAVYDLKLNPYDYAFHSSSFSDSGVWKASYQFLDASFLGARGSMAVEHALPLPDGGQIRCVQQVFSDAARWGKTALRIAGQPFPLSAEAPKTAMVRIEDREVSAPFLALLHRVYAAVSKNRNQFKKALSYLNQGPYNDMMATIQHELMRKEGCIYIPDQKSMTRAVHLLLPDGKTHKVTRMMLIIHGKFSAAENAKSGELLEARKGFEIGQFHGIATFNLSANTAVIKLGARTNPRLPEVWRREPDPKISRQPEGLFALGASISKTLRLLWD